MKRRDVVDYLALALLWGSSFLVVRRVVASFGRIGAVTFRALVAAAVLVLIAGATGRQLHFRAPWWRFAIVGATTVVGQLVFLSYAVVHIGTAMTAIFVATIPLFSMAVGHWWGVETITPLGRIGLALGVIGTVVLVGTPAVEVTEEFLIGCVAMLASTLSAAFGSNYARLHLQHVSSWDSTVASFLFAGVMSAPLLLLVPVPGPVGWSDIGWLVLLGASMSSLTYVLYFRLVADLGATVAISVEFLVTVVAVALGTSVLGERLSAPQLVAGGVIVLGCLLVLELVPARWRGAHRTDERV